MRNAAVAANIWAITGVHDSCVAFRAPPHWERERSESRHDHRRDGSSCHGGRHRHFSNDVVGSAALSSTMAADSTPPLRTGRRSRTSATLDDVVPGAQQERPTPPDASGGRTNRERAPSREGLNARQGPLRCPQSVSPVWEVGCRGEVGSARQAHAAPEGRAPNQRLAPYTRCLLSRASVADRPAGKEAATTTTTNRRNHRRYAHLTNQS